MSLCGCVLFLADGQTGIGGGQAQVLSFYDPASALTYGCLQAKEFVLGVMSLSEETFRELSIARLRELLKGGTSERWV
ncbi:MAG: hypothetical protein KatS3mg007_0003 [Thermoanaerobaculum sp.]|nr:MAG: hypothetical protein KatS3mg007_0003 [Thermoanaerobaculum sp.]